MSLDINPAHLLHDAANFVGGFANAWGSDNLLGAGRQEQSTTAGKVGAAFGDATATVQGLLEFGEGAGGEAASVALDATGVGALAGVPVNIASAGLMIHGATTSLAGLTHLAMSASDTGNGGSVDPQPSGGTVQPTKPQASPQQVQQWADQFPKKQTPNNGDPRNTYEIAQTGPENTQVQGGGEKIWADGVDSSTGNLEDAKYVANDNNSPYVNGSKVPDFVRDSVRADFEDEVRRYAAVVNDPQTPVRGLEIITNSPEAANYFESVLQKYSVPGTVVVKP